MELQCLSYVASKQTRVVIRNKLITKIDEKLDKVDVKMKKLHHSLYLSVKAYTIILLNAKTQKTWVFYLRLKDEFVNAF